VQKGWSILFGAVIFAATASFVIAPFVHGWWMPHPASTWARDVDGLFYLILGITGFFFLLTEGILVYSMYRYAGGPGRKGEYVHGHHKLEVFWTSVTAVILLIITFAQVGTWGVIKYWWAFPMFAEKDKRFQVKDQFDNETTQMEVSARQFEWRVRYPSRERMQSFEKKPGTSGYGDPADFVSTPHADDLHIVNEIHVWQGAKVLVHLKTRDVIHSFYLPNLRLKQDALPGKVIPVWFEAIDYNTIKVGDHWEDGMGRDKDTGKPNDSDKVWELACAELCGWGHYKMQGRLYVHKDREDFLDWLQDAEKNQHAREPEPSTAAR
jgi:cytochrome c oxidase subunit 2